MKISIDKLTDNKGQVDGVPKNPRYIKDDRYKKLKQSIVDDPEFMELNPILVYDTGKDFVVMGGNMRFRAIKELGWKETECAVMPKDTSVELIRSRIIKHNADFGSNDWDLLANEWNTSDLSDWGLEQTDNFAPTLNPNSERMNTTDEDICKELGMEPEELIRLKHITGFSKLFKDTEYKKSWETKTQILLKKEHKA